MIIQSTGQEIVCGSKLETSLTIVEHTTLTDICKAIFDIQLCKVDFSCHIFSQKFMRGQNYGTVSSHLLRSAHIKVYHTVFNSGLLTNTIGIGTIQKMAGACEKKELISFAQVKWLSMMDLEVHHLEQNFFPAPVQMWTDNSHTNGNVYVPFVPVASIISHVAVTHSSCITYLSLPLDLLLTIPLQSGVIDLISREQTSYNCILYNVHIIILFITVYPITVMHVIIIYIVVHLQIYYYCIII